MNVLSKRFFPVIHCIDIKNGGIGYALANTRIALINDANGVFLIGHGLDYLSMIEIYENVRKQNPDMWIGINFLDVEPWTHPELISVVVKKCIGLNGLWMDHLPNQKLDISPSIETFGGVAFKYINPNLKGTELSEACDFAKNLVDVITTSGNGTGQEPAVSKLEEIREYIGEDTRLALASGVNSENIYDFIPFVNDFLVATSITEKQPQRGNREFLISSKVLELSKIIK